MTPAEEVLAITRRIHALASLEEFAMLTRSELERLAVEQLTIERERSKLRAALKDWRPHT